MDAIEDLRNWLKAGLEDGEYSQRELSRRTSVHISQISRFIKGEDCLSLDSFRKLTQFAGLRLAPEDYIKVHMEFRQEIEDMLDRMRASMRKGRRST